MAPAYINVIIFFFRTDILRDLKPVYENDDVGCQKCGELCKTENSYLEHVENKHSGLVHALLSDEIKEALYSKKPAMSNRSSGSSQKR